MTSKRWDLTVSHKDKNGKWRSQKVGAVFAGDKGQLNIKLDPGISIYQTEGVNITAWEPKEHDGQQRGGGGRGQSSGGGYDGADTGGGDDGIPFRQRGNID
jgi:hypothetical protein